MKPSIKKTILIVIASIAGILLIAALGFYLYFIFQFSVYQDDQYKFSIKYPKAWKVIVHPRPTVAVIFLRPKDTALDRLQENFNVVVQAVPPVASSLPAFSQAIRKQMTAVFGTSINIVEDKSVQLGWREGHMMDIEGLKPDQLKMVNAWVIRSDQAYIMTFLGNVEKYGQDGVLVNEMIRSLQLQ